MLPSWLAVILTPLDIAAIVVFVAATGGYGALARIPRIERSSITGAVQVQRLNWLLNMARRENRMLDAVVLSGLSQGNAFFASTSAIVVGGLAAVLGSGEKVQGLMERLPYAARSSPVLWEVKLILVLGMFVYAFFKFAWAFRLSHYTSIMMGATPIFSAETAEACTRHATRTARLIGIAAEHTNGGLRAYYYAIAAMAWFYHPVAFMLATGWVMLILVRRDFFSRSRRLLFGRETSA